MADEKKDQATEEQPKKSRKMLFIIIAVVVVLLAAGGGVAAVFLLGGGKEAAAAEADAGKEKQQQEKLILVPLDTFIVNLADPKGDRFMKATIRLTTDDPELEQKIQSDPVLKARIRDRVLSILSSKTFQDVNNPVGKESLRRELQRELNQVLPEDSIKEVLFVEFIVQ